MVRIPDVHGRFFRLKTAHTGFPLPRRDSCPYPSRMCPQKCLILHFRIKQNIMKTWQNVNVANTISPKTLAAQGFSIFEKCLIPKCRIKQNVKKIGQNVIEQTGTNLGLLCFYLRRTAFFTSSRMRRKSCISALVQSSRRSPIFSFATA